MEMLLPGVASQRFAGWDNLRKWGGRADYRISVTLKRVRTTRKIVNL